MEDFKRFNWHGVEAVVMDDHHWAFYLWWDALERGLIEKGAALVHVDQHKDMRVPSRGFEGSTAEEARKYVEDALEVGNYIVPALECGLIGDVQFVTGEAGMKMAEEEGEAEDGGFFARKNKILNLDLDIFVPELGLDFEAAKKFLLRHLEGASFVTIAKSPGFIDQELAVDMLERLL